MYWVDLINQTQKALLEIAIGHAPQALFPIDVHRKFGFDTPVGALFDHSNFIPLQEALGEELVSRYRKHYETKDPPASALEWARSRPDLSDQEILDSWSDDIAPSETNKSFEQRVFHLCALNKAKTCGLLFVFSNADIEHEFQRDSTTGTITIKK